MNKMDLFFVVAHTVIPYEPHCHCCRIKQKFQGRKDATYFVTSVTGGTTSIALIQHYPPMGVLGIAKNVII